MRLRRFSTVRARLLALLVLIAVPIACASAFAAYATYRAAIVAIEAAQARAADDFAVRTRVWYRGMSRALLAFGTTASERGLDTPGCRDAGVKAMERAGGYRAFFLRQADGRLCSGTLDPDLTTEALGGLVTQLAGRPAVGMWNGANLGRMRYDQVTAGGRRYLAILASDLPGANGGLQQALLLVAPELLENVFDLGEDGQVQNVALIGRDAGVIASRGDNREPSWLPLTERMPAKHVRWSAPNRAGVDSVFAARMVAEPDFYIVASFDERPAEAARLQFIVLLLAPLLTLGLLCLVCMRAIDKHCLRWLRGIETAARSRTANNRVRATVADGMPSDIRSVAEAFNGMVEEQEVRQRRLQTALDDNRFLVRELHHRVKNSLQVVQSYIGLSKRDHRDEARLALADAECRVHVLSAAYRFTLADGEMQPVRVDLFLDDVVTMISNLIRSRDQWVTSRIETAATLSVDRIIPLGFLVADVASRALRGTPGVRIVIDVLDVDEAAIEVGLAVDRDIQHSAPPRLFAGLLTQIEAVQTQEPQGRSLGRWRIGHGS
ncbi:histidine kinase dimerization/phosphoacceptor domain -containing protein [Bosea sp. UC22_33]|uniref:histidine kinase dimerization/phosphoacceptor domain -containing protein n=1 Tax=Bosea sp. UC22_33 TaxID=3350165 RepID=UPI00366BA766